MVDVYFENEIERELLAIISSSKERIYLAVAWFTNHIFFDELMKSLKRNVRIKIIVLDDILNRNEFGLNFGELVNYGANIRMKKVNESIMHNKFCVIDNKVITGSYNWTYHANLNDENIVVIDDNIIVNKYCQNFNRIFEKAKDISMPYQHVKWEDIQERDFTEIRKKLFLDVKAKNDENSCIRCKKIISLGDAYKSGNPEKIISASTLPSVEKFKTITDVLTNSPSTYSIMLWEESKAGKPLDDVDGHIKLCKWIFLPFEIREDNHNQYVEGKLKTYSSRHDIYAGGLKLDIYDKQFVETIKKYDNKKQGYYWYKVIPEYLLCIEYAKMFFYRFPTPLFNESQPRTWPNTEKRLIYGIDVFTIAKEENEDGIVFYKGWNPQERGLTIQNKFFCKK